MKSRVLHVIDSRVEDAFALRASVASEGLTCELYTSSDDFFRDYRPADLECIVISLTAPDECGLEFQHQLEHHHWPIPVLATHTRSDAAIIVQTMLAGAMDFLAKPYEYDDFLVHVKRLLEIDARIKSQILDRTSRLVTLSPREREVLEYLLQAATTNAIANRLNISPKTAEKHRTNILTKMNVASVPELMKLMLPVGQRRDYPRQE